MHLQTSNAGLGEDAITRDITAVRTYARMDRRPTDRLWCEIKLDPSDKSF